MARAMRRIGAAVLAVCLGVWAVADLHAQTTARRGRLVVTVVDQLGAVIPQVAVTVTPADQALAAPTAQGGAQTSVPAPVLTNKVGVAVIDDLPEGRYNIRAEFEGFDPTDVKDFRVRGAETKRTITLRIRKQEETVTVSRERQSSSLDPAGSAFSTVLTREQIAALPDDPDEMAEVLKAMSPPGSVIRVDGFTGGRLPPKSQIRSIRLPRLDMFAAQNHGGMGGMMFIDIMTMPGNGPLRGSVDFNFFDDALNARNPFSTTKPDEQLKQAGFSLSGTIAPNKTSFSLNGGGNRQYTSPILVAVAPDGTPITGTIEQPRDGYNFSARIDHAINKDHAARLSIDADGNKASNLGVGGFSLPARAFNSEGSNVMLRLSENGPLGKRFFIDTRFQLRLSNSSNSSVTEDRAIVVQDAFTTGGAQQRGGQHTREFDLSSDLDYVRGPHSWRTGIQVEGGHYRSDDMTNYLGTYSFASLADYQAGRPTTYTRRIGDPNVEYSTLRAGVYVQDDFRITRSMLFSPGVRFGFQNHTSDPWNLSPRMSLAWSPRRDGKVTLRGSYGYFYDWVANDLYKQTLLVDGFRQREMNILFPSYPDPGVNGTTAPTNRYLWSNDLTLPNAHRASVAVDVTLSANGRASISYTGSWGEGLLRGRNLNPPLAGARPDPSFSNVVELVSDAQSRGKAISAFYSYVRMDKKRLFFTLNYTWSKSETNTTGAFSLPANGDNLATEWGPGGGDIRHRFGGSVSLSPFTNFSMSLNGRVQSGSPFNITTGRDDNGDGVFNDRPAGVSRNAARGAAIVDLGGRMSWGFGFGTPKQQGGQSMTMVAVSSGGGGGLSPGFGGAAANKRYQVEFYLSAQNVLNRTNYTAYSFVQTSPFYGRPIAASQPRKFQVGARFSF